MNRRSFLAALAVGTFTGLMKPWDLIPKAPVEGLVSGAALQVQQEAGIVFQPGNHWVSVPYDASGAALTAEKMQEAIDLIRTEGGQPTTWYYLP